MYLLEPPSTIVCPNCGDGQKVMDPESGELICTNCGFVVYEKIGEEWAGENLANQPAASSSGSRTSLARTGVGLPTIIGRPDKNAGSGMDAAMRARFDRLRTWDFRIKGQNESSRRSCLIRLFWQQVATIDQF